MILAIFATFCSSAETSFEVLSRHHVKATYAGVEHIPCRFMTSLCPDRCNHAKDVAKFIIEDYISYEKLGKYGDERQEVFMVNVKENVKNDDHFEVDQQDEKVLQFIKGLKAGDHVKLIWEHIYTSKDGSQYPERIVRNIQRA